MSEEAKGQVRISLPKEQARQLTTTQKTRPMMESISSRNLLKVLPWVNVVGGFYRVNRRQILEIRPNLVTFTDDNGQPKIYPPSLNQIPVFRTVQDEQLLTQIAEKAEKVEFEKDASIKSQDENSIMLYLIAIGKVSLLEDGVYNNDSVIVTLGPGQYFADFGKNVEEVRKYMAKAKTAVTIFKISEDDIKTILADDHLEDHLNELERLGKLTNRKGEALINMYSGLHDDEPSIPGTYVAYDEAPREYELYSSQTILKIHSKVADLHNNPYNQTHEQIRLTVEELREKQEYEMINNKDFGLLHSADFRQRIHTKTGPPTPDDLDELLSKRRKTKYIFAHPRAIAAFLRECTKRGIYPSTVEIDGKEVVAWRGCPILTSNKIPIVNGLTSMIAIRVGEEDQGVVGLYQMALPDEIEPSLSVRFMSIDEKAIISYLITNYYSLAVLVPDALGILENVEVGVHES
ncbi:family 2B encapsulin nanocompartment shell protein [Algoriphagus namhaensis]|uniref:Family 2B encapsulin nanocompartment shell protein n=1 Tax=Algoriphagus namhaensis TaxID=915353 RepID=A0ABV8ASF0_9BACT